MVALSPVTWGLIAAGAVLALGVGLLVFFMIRGWLTLDLGWGRSIHPLGPITVRIAAPRDLVFEVVSAPYLGRTPRSLGDRLEVLERDERLVVAAHRSRLRYFVSTTVETVSFQPPERVTFRHLRGPVPHAVEEFVLRDRDGQTELEYRGEIGIDFWILGRLAGRYLARPNWERVVRPHLEEVKRSAEERSAARSRRRAGSGGGVAPG